MKTSKIKLVSTFNLNSAVDVLFNSILDAFKDKIELQKSKTINILQSIKLAKMLQNRSK
mgnify:CR=1 FL=1